MEEHKFTFDGSEYKIVKPNNKVRKESDAVYAKAYRKAIAEGFFLEAEIDNIIKERGIKAANEKEKKLIDAEIALLEEKFTSDSFENLSDGLEAFERISQLRKSLDELDKAKRELSSQSASIVAENERFSFFVFSCSFNAADEKIWDKLEEYKDDMSDLANKFSSEMIQIVYGGAQEIMEELAKIRPENIWYKVKNENIEEKLESSSKNS